ncbi:3-hydroxyacyl-CoA dehydrogenase NAD-binding domain-containing protein [Streptomyces sp. LP05-1]|uniref:3-hydroxyacyl-CoA dehydrogenase NAD-binding domain-containing protein n=1 Tax=Streptomyces pyxinae TaxID=2970734 RepID=A0ABT2CJY6_9ACTN|nr:3-hydroxyacyl-CoA dehydrogenase NAD-binding domain-containing protein [Streptomyces sp. LP05-1]MCS0637735.1 3-hydroxyacyl-CoA dehydrogenase NAD-binding domain-containing protein [Streptomyces sp. LP05-1]
MTTTSNGERDDHRGSGSGSGSGDGDILAAHRRVTVVGAGVIGTSWTALFLAHGLRVTVSDPAEGAEKAVRTQLRELAAGFAAVGTPLPDEPLPLRFEPDLEKAVADADLVQENGPERLELKRELFARIEAAAPARALLATSTSGLLPSDIARDLREPERLVVAHPFNPPHLQPLVEIVPGERTSPATVDRAVALYRALGRRPQVLRKEISGFVGNRLQSALFREAVHLVTEGVVTEEELDAVVRDSIGLRWAAAGPFRSFHLGGGPGGLAHFLDHLAPGMERRWPDLGTPSFDAPTRRLLLEQAEESFGAHPYAELTAERDRTQLALLRARAEAAGEPSPGAADQPG